MESQQSVATLPRAGTRTRSPWTLDWLRQRVTTTPGRLTLVSVLVVAGAVLFGVIATTAERSRSQAAQAVRSQTEPLLVQAATLYSALGDAEATATTTFLTGGLEPPALRTRYRQDLLLASYSLAALTREVGGSSAAHAALVTITEQLPVYSGLIETARANNRQGFPVGAAYLRQAAGLLNGTILPQADLVYSAEAKRLSDNYATGTGDAALVVLALVIAAALGLLALTQLYVAHVSRRILNVPMLLATVVLIGVSIWAIVGLLGEQSALSRARSQGSDSVEVLSATRVMLSRAQGDESLTRVGRGSDETDPVDFARVINVLSPPSGLIGEIGVLARRTGTTSAADRLATKFAAFRSSPTTPSVANGLSDDLTRQIIAAQGRFKSAAADGTSSLSGLSVAIPLLTLLVAGLALIGLRQRLEEYR